MPGRSVDPRFIQFLPAIGIALGGGVGLVLAAGIGGDIALGIVLGAGIGLVFGAIALLLYRRN